MAYSKAIVLFSGGLDSILAARILQIQNVHVEALCILTPYHHCHDLAKQAADMLDLDFCARWVDQDYYQMLCKPRHGRGGAANPCTDCHAYMAKMAYRRMQETGADFVATGEVLGQRPCSQKRLHLDIISKSSGLGDLLLRPLSAKLLPETRPEREGRVCRDLLYEFSGRRRTELHRLANELKIGLPTAEIAEKSRVVKLQYGSAQRPSPSSGCKLTLKDFAPRFFDMFDRFPAECAEGWHYGTLGFGRHFRLTSTAKLVLGRNQEENAILEQFFHHPSRHGVLMMATGFAGPTGLLMGEISDESIRLAGGLLLRFAKQTVPQQVLYFADRPGVVTPELRTITPTTEANTPRML